MTGKDGYTFYRIHSSGSNAPPARPEKLVTHYLPKATKLARIGQEIERLLAAGPGKS